METLRMTRCESVRLAPDPRRVITKPFLPREEIYADGSTRMQVVLAPHHGDVGRRRQRDAAQPLAALFAGRHRDLDAVFDRSFGVVAEHLDWARARTHRRSPTIGVT